MLVTVRRIEFMVSSVSPAPLGRLRISGRCCEGPLRVGDLFSRAESRLMVRNELEARSLTAESRPAAFVVLEMRAYGHVLDQVEAGLTAEVLVEPVPPSVVAPNEVLVGAAIP